MPKLNIKIPHQLTHDEASKRIQGLLGELKNEFAGEINNVREKWEENTDTFSFSIMGFSISGTLTVKPSEVELSSNLPFAAALFKGKIESMIQERAKTLLA